MGEIIEEWSLRNKVHVFENRFDAGRKLADFLLDNDIEFDLVLAIPNGGVAVGLEIAKKLEKELKVAIVRKATYPWTTEAGFGAVSWTGEVELETEAVKMLSKEEVEASVARAKKSVEERLKLFKDFLPGDLKNLRVVIVDDGLATGYTMLVAVKSVRKLGAREVVVAVPTSSEGAARMVAESADLLLVLNLRSSFFYAVADAYKRWRDLLELEVLNLLLSLKRGV